jgi:hypothetical protein
MRRRVLASLFVVMAVAVACAGTLACAGREDEALPPAPPIVPTTTTTVIDYSTVPLAAVETKTTTTVNGGPGRARLLGTVVGPDGPVPEAVVRVERLQGDSVVFRGDVASDAEGRWQTGRLVGGRWRVRAWKVPDLADVTPEILFLEATQTKSLVLGLDRFAGPAVTPAIAPDPAYYGVPANLVVAVTNRVVDGEGVVRGVPIPGLPVQLFAPNWNIASPNPAMTDADGRVSWLLGCAQPGPEGMFVTLHTGERLPLEMAPCSVPPTTTTAPASP